MRIKLRFALAAPLLAAFVLTACAAPLEAQQSTLEAAVVGQVLDASGRPVSGVVLTLVPENAGARQETTSGPGGAFAFRYVTAGTYELRAEAIGYRPLVARTIRVVGGDRVRVPLLLTEEAPPVTAVDTLLMTGVTDGRIRPGGVRFGDQAVDGLPYRFEDLTSVVSLSSHFDPSLGSQGLPGSMTLVYADGLPVYRAQHPVRREEHLADAFFPRSFLAGITALHDAPDVEWSGAAGGYAPLTTRAGVGGSDVAVEGWGSFTPLWSSGELDLESTPDLLSYHAAGRAAAELVPDTTQILVAAEALRQEVPLAPRLPDALIGPLTGLDSELLVSLAAPSVERVERYSGLGRFYTRPNETSHVLARGVLTRSQREFEGPGPLPVGRWGGLGETSTDFSLAGSFVSELQPDLAIELRAGVSGSDRTFVSAVPELPSAYLVEAGLPIGSVPGAAAQSSRTDAVFLPIVRWDLTDAGALKAGALARASRHSMTTDLRGAGDFLFTDPAALLAGTGLGRAATVVEATFTTREFGAFAQYDLSLVPGLDLTVGGRLDYETIPGAEPTPSAAWRDVSGLDNTEYPTGFAELGGRVLVSWDPANDGRTRLYALGTAHHGNVDPSHLFEVFGRDGTTTTTAFLGTGIAWPEGTLPAAAPTLPTLALLGPDLRPPRSLRASLGVTREIAAGLSVHLAGNLRRTDFLLRRRDLNLAQAPSTVDVWSRPVWGLPAKEGALVAASGDDGRRFPSFGAVYAFDPDGWSEYQAVTAGLEYRGDVVELYGSFTRSETRDNWIGAAAGSPEAELSPRLPDFVEAWDDARSDFDVPTRVSGTAVFRVPALPGAELAATYSYRSGRPFTPGYRRGVDANADGSFENDVAFVPQPAELGDLLDEWDCLRNQAGGFAVRNSCRGPARHDLDLRLQVGLGEIGGQPARLFVDALGLVETEDGLIDDALLLVDPDQPLAVTGTSVRIPVAVNDNFGDVLIPTSRGRILRFGLQIGG